MASRVSLIQSRSIYIGTSNAVAPSDGNLIVTGNVGIGTTAPNSPLEVNGRVSIRGANELYFGQSTSGIVSWTTRMYASGSTHKFNANTFVFNNEGYGSSEFLRITSAGNVGIGTTAPAQKFEVYGDEGQPATSGTTQNGMVRFRPGSTEGWGEALDFGMHIGVSGPASYAWLQATNAGNLAINYNIAINPNGGNVGIGTTSPATKLDVDGIITATGGNSTNWNTAYGWGNHASAGYSTATGVANNADNYGSWNLKTNDTQRTTVGSGGDLNLVAGTNVSLSYSAGGTVTITSTDTQLTDAQVRSKISGTGLISYNSTTGVISTTANNYSLPAGSSTTRGGFKIGYAENGKNYPVEVTLEKMYVNVPWTDTNTDTITSVGISGSETTGTVTLTGAGATTTTQVGGAIEIRSTDTTYAVGDGGLTEKNFTTALKNKLDGIATGATNVTNNNQLTNGAGYLTAESDTLETVIARGATTSNGILDNASARIIIPGGAYSVNNQHGTGGAIRINLPIATYGVNTMMSMTVQVYEYSTGQSFTIRCGGYNYHTHAWYNVFAYLLNDSGKGSDVPVYFGNDGTRGVIWIGNPNWSWSYPNVFVTDFQAGHAQTGSWRTGWSISFDTAARTNVSASRTAHRQIDTGNIASQSVSFATDADLLDGQQGSYYLDWTNVTNKPDTTVTLAGDATGSATFTDLGNATLTVTVANDSHQHSALYEDSVIDFGSSKVQWTDQNGVGGTGLDGAAPRNPANGWYHNLIMNHANSAGYYSQISTGLNTSDIYFSRVQAGSPQPWQRIFADDYHPNADTLTTARTLTIGNTGKTFNGSANVSWTLAEIGAQAAGSYLTTSGKAADSELLDGIDSSGFQRQIDESIVNIVSPNASNGTWNAASTAAWGTPRIGSIAARYNDGTGYLQFNVPAGMDSAYVSHLTWSSGGYVDCYGVQADGGLVFLRRINTRQSIENSNEGDNDGNPSQHDGSTISLVGTGLSAFSAVRLQNRVGRFHLTGMSFTSAKLQGTEGTGMVHPGQLSVSGSGSGLDADLLDGLQATAFATSAQGTNADTAHSWGNHASAGYSTASGVEDSADVTDTANVVAALTAGTNVSIATNGTISATDTNTQLTDAQVRSKISGTGLIGYNSSTGVISTTANNYVHPTTAGNKHIPTGGAAGQFLKYSSSGTAVWATPSYTTSLAWTSITGKPTLDNYLDWKLVDGAGTASDVRSANYVRFQSSNIVGTGTQADPYVVTTPNTTYAADGNYGMALNGTAFRLENDRRRNSSTQDIYTGNTHDYTFYDADIGIRWYTAGAEEMRLEDDGDLHVDGDVIAFSTTVSDARLKDDVQTIENATEKVNKLRGVSYTWNQGSRKGQREIGVIAQEVEDVVPEIVHEKKLPFVGNETYKTVDYEKIVALLIESNKELTARVKQLEARLDGTTK